MRSDVRLCCWLMVLVGAIRGGSGWGTPRIVLAGAVNKGSCWPDARFSCVQVVPVIPGVMGSWPFHSGQSAFLSISLIRRLGLSIRVVLA